MASLLLTPGLSHNEVQQIIGEIDPDQIRCDQCRQYHHRMSTTTIDYPLNWKPWTDSTTSFQGYLRHRGIRNICDLCCNTLKDAWTSGFAAGNHLASKEIEKIHKFEKYKKRV